VVALGVFYAFTFVLCMAVLSPLIQEFRGSKWVDRLAERARWRHSPGVRGLRGWHAWRKLARASKRHPTGRAVDALWGAWVWDPDDKDWALFRRWRGQNAVTDLATALAAALAAAPLVNDCPAAMPFYELLCACLELRFGGEIGIALGPARAGADEIGISREESAP
jgi:hypothetical protein